MDILGRYFSSLLSPFDPANSIILVAQFAVYLAAKQYAEALAIAQRVVRESPKYAMAQRAMVLIMAALGRMDEAKTAAQRLMQLTPDFTVSRYRMAIPIKDAAYRKQCAAWLRSAGVPL